MKKQSNISRRQFVGTVGATAAFAAMPTIVRGQTAPEVIIVGGGFAGATAAKYIRKWSNYTINVTLVEKKSNHVSCILSNLVLNEQLALKDLRLRYGALQDKHGVRVVRSNVKNVFGDDRQIQLAEGNRLAYDRLVLATGISFKKPSGLKYNKVPHAWIAGSQTNLLRNQLRAMPGDGTFVMTIPKSPYRCPPGPYERACTVADLLGRRSGVIGGTGTSAPRVVVLDANDGIQAEKETFSRAYEGIYGDIIEYYPGVTLEAVDSDHRVAITTAGDFHSDVLNVIPTHRSGWLVRKARISEGANWAAVNPLTYESTNSSFPGVHIIGDSQGTGQPKSGHMANAQAKVCADAIVRSLDGRAVDDPDRLNNIRTNSACYSPITHNEASWLTAVFQLNTETGQMELAPGSLGEARNWSRDSYDKMFAWASNLFTDSFG